MNEFYVGSFRVDMGRSQIIAQDDILSIEPKVLQVLLILAESQGQVVTHDRILTKVWPDVQVAPNALQRCIAQLRKAFGDDAKNQKIIATHPKIGYSLIAQVNWQTKIDDQDSAPFKSQGAHVRRLNPWIFTGVVSMLLISIAFIYNSQNTGLPIQQVTPMTATDNKEFSPTYSPDGRYIAFQRFVGHCENQIWAKNISDNKEYLLTKTNGIYGTPSWSPDGQKLAFSNLTQCTREFLADGCREIHTLNFALAKSSPQPSQRLLSCDQQSYSAAVWLSNNKIAFIAKDKQQNSVLTKELSQDKMELLYRVENAEPYSLSYSQRFNKLALMLRDKSQQAIMVIIEPDTDIVDEVELSVPAAFQSHRNWNSNWHPERESLISANKSSIFEIQLNGEMTEYLIPTVLNIFDPFYHPDGTSIIASMGVVDLDISQLKWKTDTSPIAKPDSNQQIVHRSIFNEQNAQYQPGGDKIAFTSRRTGSEQIWLGSGQTLSQLSNLSDNSYIDSFEWSTDGQLIAAVSNKQLHLLNLDGDLQKIKTPFEVLEVFQWLDQQQLLLKVLEDSQIKVVVYGLTDESVNTFYKGDVNWAQLSDKNILFVSSYERKLWRINNNKKYSVEALSNIRISGRFFYDNQQLILLSKTSEVWRYQLDRQKAYLVFSAVDDINMLSDSDFASKRILFSKIISAKKEIVMFHQ